MVIICSRRTHCRAAMHAEAIGAKRMHVECRCRVRELAGVGESESSACYSLAPLQSHSASSVVITTDMLNRHCPPMPANTMHRTYAIAANARIHWRWSALNKIKPVIIQNNNAATGDTTFSPRTRRPSNRCSNQTDSNMYSVKSEMLYF